MYIHCYICALITPAGGGERLHGSAPVWTEGEKYKSTPIPASIKGAAPDKYAMTNLHICKGRTQAPGLAAWRLLFPPVSLSVNVTAATMMMMMMTMRMITTLLLASLLDEERRGKQREDRLRLDPCSCCI